jgi:pimeloyl-ACP methyl ester carboxylesterase
MRVNVGAVELAVEVGGDPSGPPVLFLHGWPDSHEMWRNQLVALGEAGFRTVAPDLRGFGDSDKPADVEAYGMFELMGDVAGLLDALDIPRAHVVAHDWGSGLAWVLAAFLPDRVDHLVALSVGHPRSFGNAGFEQLEKSWYMLLFQFAGVAEQWLSMDDWANFKAWADHPDHDAVTARLADPAAVTAGLNWYRANVPPTRLVTEPFEFPPIVAPTMAVWSDRDIFLVEAGVVNSKEHVSGPFRYERVANCGHWIPLEQPDALNALLLDFLPDPHQRGGQAGS